MNDAPRQAAGNAGDGERCLVWGCCFDVLNVVNVFVSAVDRLNLSLFIAVPTVLSGLHFRMVSSVLMLLNLCLSLPPGNCSFAALRCCCSSVAFC